MKQQPLRTPRLLGVMAICLIAWVLAAPIPLIWADDLETSPTTADAQEISDGTSLASDSEPVSPDEPTSHTLGSDDAASDPLQTDQPLVDTSDENASETETQGDDATDAVETDSESNNNDVEDATGQIEESESDGAVADGDSARPDSITDEPDATVPENGDSSTEDSTQTDDESIPTTEENESDDSSDEVEIETPEELAPELPQDDTTLDIEIPGTVTEVGDGWVRSGSSWVHYSAGELDRGWLVTNVEPGGFAGGLQRYWLDPQTGELAASELLSAQEAGWWAYATPSGWVVRGKWTDPSTGLVYLADNDGRLASPGWVVSSSYGDGLQRYWVDEQARACVPGFSEEGWAHYTTSAGYVLRGKMTLGSGVLLANNDGKLATGSGWLVTSTYDGTLQRYWLEKCCNGITGAKTGYFEVNGASYYGLSSKGYVSRNAHVQVGNSWYQSNNDGKLTYLGSAMWYKAQGYSSSTRYLLMIDSTSHTVGVYTGSYGNWTELYSWPCGNGAASTPTVKGTFTVTSRGYSFGTNEYTCYYWTQFYGDYLFHSILYYAGTFTVLDDTLGASVSHGCVRLDINNAKWIYNNIPNGTKVVSY